MSGDVTVLFFARLRDAMGTGETRVALPATPLTAGELLSRLCADDPSRSAALEGLTVKAAVNRVQVPLDAPVAPGDEVAFFPPVTGG